VLTSLQTTPALKEWQVAVEALERGETILLLRKGGIREVGGRFQVAHDRVLLYPTFEHQQPDLLKPAYAAQVQPVRSGWHPDNVRIGSWAIITDTLQVTQSTQLAALLPFHIWNERFVTERFAWKPSQPLYVLLLRVFRLATPHQIPYDARYGGCKSWIELMHPIALNDATPVLSEAAFEQQVNSIRAHCA
jgi:hypothetical protein